VEFLITRLPNQNKIIERRNEKDVKKTKKGTYKVKTEKLGWAKFYGLA
jgi:hypothetical protein